MGAYDLIALTVGLDLVNHSILELSPLSPEKVSAQTQLDLAFFILRFET